MKIRLRLLLPIVLFVFVAGLVIGAQWFRLDLFPIPQLHDLIIPPETRVPLDPNMITLKYTAKTPVFLDKLYYDTIGDERLEGLSLVQIPRHHSENVVIDAYGPSTIYRFISEDNDNTDFDSWTPSDIPIHVRGFTTTHTRVVKKDFPAGIITLVPGGPIASSPILIKVHDYTSTEPTFEFEVLDLEMSTVSPIVIK
jgi:hypothetical protein